MARNNGKINVNAWVAIGLTVLGGIVTVVGVYYKSQIDALSAVSDVKIEVRENRASYDSHVANQYGINLRLQKEIKELGKGLKVVSDNVIKIGERLRVRRMRSLDERDE